MQRQHPAGGDRPPAGPGPAPADCPTVHYSLPASCSLAAGHRDTWHQTAHPESGRVLRFCTAGGILRTQEWVPSDDPEAAGAGEWITWHYVTPEAEPTPTVPEDLDQRAASLVAGHFPTSRIRSREAGVEAECGCGGWYPIGREDAHLGREVSLLARAYFDIGLRHGAATQPTG